MCTLPGNPGSGMRGRWPHRPLRANVGAMHDFTPFEMERWQSLHENDVDYNLSESGVHPLAVRELLALAGNDVGDVVLGYGHSNGSPELREAIARLYAGAEPHNVKVANGSAEANFIALWRLVRPGDEVAILVPTYMQTYGLASASGARVVEIPLHEDAGWQPDPDEIRRSIGERTRLVIVTNPSNPTGAILSDSAREALIDAAARHGAWLLADEVYIGAELDGRRTTSFWGSYERVVATGSLSKAYGLPGLRIGWAVAPPALTAELWARTDYTTISPGTLTDRLATLALDDAVRPQLLGRTRRILRDGIASLEAWFEDRGIFEHRRPDAGAICFARYHADIDSLDLADRLRREYSVLVVPGAHFGFGRWIRFGYGLPVPQLRAALGRLGSLLDTVDTATAAG